MCAGAFIYVSVCILGSLCAAAVASDEFSVDRRSTYRSSRGRLTLKSQASSFKAPALLRPDPTKATLHKFIAESFHS